MNGWWALVIVVCAPTVAILVVALLDSIKPKQPAPAKERCLFDDGHEWLIGGETVGGQSCSGPPSMRLAFWEGHPAQHLTGRLVCTGHVGATSELAAKIARESLS